jgi:hypothetical protein
MNNIVSIVEDLNKIRLLVESGELVLSEFDKISLSRLIGTASELLLFEEIVPLAKVVSQDDDKA